MHRDLTPEQQADMDEDIIRRLELQRAMAANTYAVIECELGISETTIRNIESGQYQYLCPYKVSAKVRQQVRARRGAWHLGNEAMQEFTVRALAAKYGVNFRVIEKRIKVVREWVNSNRQEAKAA